MFLVRKGNPKGIKDWDDLIKPGVQVITPNPKTSGGARWNYLAAWGYGLKKYGSEDKAKKFVGDIYKNVPVLDTGARGSTVTFVERGVGDVLLAWENEAFLAVKEFRQGQVRDRGAAAVDPRRAAGCGCRYGRRQEGHARCRRGLSEILVHQGRPGNRCAQLLRPRDAAVGEKYADSFAKVSLFTIDDVFGGWTKAQKEHFGEGGVFRSDLQELI